MGENFRVSRGGIEVLEYISMEIGKLCPLLILSLNGRLVEVLSDDLSPFCSSSQKSGVQRHCFLKNRMRGIDTSIVDKIFIWGISIQESFSL